jgi:hypothetical protein
MAGELEFSFDDVLAEINAMREIGAPFIDAGAPDSLTRLAKELEAVRATGHGRESIWGISEKIPLRTRVSNGGYEPDDQGEHNIYAEMTSKWTIAPTGPRPARKHSSKYFAIVGAASVRIRIKESGGNNDGRQLGMWRAELGDPDSPGCYFHIQVLGEDVAPPFPHSMSVPRFPAIAFTPMAALEFAIGELFQDQWPREAAREGGPRDIWRGIQRRRLVTLFDWQRKLLEKQTGSPWRALKLGKPEPGLFTSTLR